MRRLVFSGVVASVVVALLLGLFPLGCARPNGASSSGADAEVTTRGSYEVTARLVEVPEGAVFERDLYNYATILKYRVEEVHRGVIDDQLIYVGHYNPFKPRAAAADRRAPDVGGDLREFEAGQLHRMALEAPIDDHYMGGIVNKYFGENTEPIYWAVWTNRADR